MTKEKKKNEELDKTSADVNTKAPAINYPEEVKKKQRQTSGNPSGDGKPKVRKETKEIDFHFTSQELQDKGKKLANVLQEKTKIEEEKKQNADAFKLRIDAKSTEADVLIEHLTIGMERKIVTVEVRRNFDSGQREYWYNGEKRGEEALTAKDHQLDIDDAEEIKKIEDKKEIPFDLKLAAGDWIVTKKGSVIQITADDVLNGIKTETIARLATEEEIAAGEKVVK